ncbi:MAG: PqqD family protein [Lachnospiraceae bacterium]|nr:PqqD family protein [Lachnospiraceae bacterium]
MKLRKDFITHESDGEQIMVAGSTSVFSGMVRSNRTAAFIVNCLKEETTQAEIVDAMAAKYDAPREVIEADVNKIIEKLNSIGAIE